MGMDFRVTQVLIRRLKNDLEDIDVNKKESQDSRTSDHPTFGHRVMVNTGRWRRVMSMVF